MNQKPQPTMMRNDQNSTGTLGIVLAAARAMSSCVARVGIVHRALEQQRVAEVVGIVPRMPRAAALSLRSARSFCIAP